MKKIIFLAGSLFCSVMAFAQEIHSDDIPSIVLNTFKQKFPKASDIEWKLKNQLYNVEFEVGRIDHEAWISNTGAIVKHKHDIAVNELPKEVSNSIERSYKGFRIDDAEKIEDGEKLLYKVELKAASKEQEVVFDQKGELVKDY